MAAAVLVRIDRFRGVLWKAKALASMTSEINIEAEVRTSLPSSPNGSDNKVVEMKLRRIHSAQSGSV